MNKFELKHTSGYNFPLDSTTTKSFQAETLDEVFFHFTDFLRGVGYVFDGNIGIVSDKDDVNQFEFDFTQE